MYPYLNVFGKTIGSYGLFMALGFLTVGALAVIRARKRGILAEDVLIVAAVAVGMALIWGKLTYILVTYPFSVIIEQLAAGNFQIFSSGGIVFYGGLIGGLLGAILGIKIARCSLFGIEAAVVPYIPLGHALGRVGCLLAGCCHGVTYDGFLAVHYTHSIAGLLPEQGYFPIQLVEAACNIGICVCLLFCERRKQRPFDLLFTYLGLYAIVRFFLEFFRGDGVRGIYFSLSVSQWISLGLLIACCVRAILSVRAAQRKK